MMAGQVQEPISFDFQADSVHSGSVSFGRFANEPLLWERRSSFSHNRILEEVERCSKHGIVTEKKAYFEAQFKKKAFLRQCSLDEQNGIQCETSEKENPDPRSIKENYEFVQGNKDDARCDTSVNIGYSEDYDYVQEAEVDVHFDESSDASNDIEEKEMMDYHVEGREILISDPLKYPLSDSINAKAKVDARTLTPVDAQTVIDCTYSRCNSAEHDVEVELNIDGDTCYVYDGCKAIDLCATSRKAKKEPDAASDHRDLCPKITAATEPSGTEPNVKVTRTQGYSLSEAAKKPSRNLTRMGKQSAQETKTFKHSKLIPSSANKWPRSPNPKHLLTQWTTSVSKSGSGSQSVCKETRVVKVTKSQVTTLMKDPPITRQTPNRAEKVTAPNNSSLKTSPTSFRFRSDMQAEKRKEILTRMEQRDRIKKTEINQNHGRTQDKTAAEIKQCRRGSNLKAKPMLSFGDKAERLELKSKGTVANKPHKIPSIPRTNVVARTPMHLKTETGPSKSPSQVSMITSYPGKKPMKTSAISSFAKKSTNPSSMRNTVGTKEMGENGKDAKLKNLTVPRNTEMIKGKGNVGTSQSINERSSKCIIRKGAAKVRPQD